MIEKKEGLINEIVYNNTVYYNGKYTHFVNIIELSVIINEIISANSTTKYILFNPFYRNSRLNGQIEFNEYMFYMECRDDFTETDLNNHLTACMDHIYDIPHIAEEYENMNKDKKRMARILYPLCKNGDYESYNKHLQDYKDYLDELIPLLFKEAVKKLKLSQEDIAFGYFCFEIDSA